MGKNYTLYINQERFSRELNKSGLVNELLNMHYVAHPFNPDAPIGTPEHPKLYIDGVEQKPRAAVKTIKTPEQASEAVTQIFGDKVIKYCKHGAAKGFCKKGCK